ncbi:hypothetical protein [Actinomadura geliboluensis]|uniref:hypothetical protein n=1 Tax=Actinomadura geliboluensis TaxID=882440 RepID=UPI0036B1A79C
MDSLFEEEEEPASLPDAMPRDLPPESESTELSVYEPSFPARVAAFLRFAPIIETVRAARHKEWPPDTYDIVTLALAVIDMVVARQGLDLEATRDDVLAAVRELAHRAAPDRPDEEHREVGVFVLDAMLNRAGREGPFQYVTSDYATREGGHLQRRVPFSLLVEHDDATRDENVLRATPDAINALIGGLDFDVEDEQVATELILERQLIRGSFDAARRSAERARLLSVRLADDLDRLLKQTRRDLRTVESEWNTAVPERLKSARDHIRERLQTERRLLDSAQSALVSQDAKILTAAVRVDRLLRECHHRHEELHKRVIGARGVFLDEQERQSFRAPAPIEHPDPQRQVLLPLLELGSSDAIALTGRFVTDMCGPHAHRLPRLYRLINDLWARPAGGPDPGQAAEETELAEPPAPLIRPLVIDVAARAVASTGLPARLSTLIHACHQDSEEESAEVRRQGAELLCLAVLWAYSPEDAGDEASQADDLINRILGPRAAVDSDGTRLPSPGWAGDDVIVAPDSDALADAEPAPTRLSTSPVPPAWPAAFTANPEPQKEDAR